MSEQLVAHDIAADPDLYYRVVMFPGSHHTWECMGYSRTGNTIRFARLVPQLDGHTICQVNCYIDPDTPVILIGEAQP